MPKTAAWRDATKTTRGGITIPEFRLHLPSGDLILRLVDGAPFDRDDKTKKFYQAQCLSVYLPATPLNESDEAKAKKAAVALAQRHIQGLQAACEQNLEALNHIIDTGKKKPDPAADAPFKEKEKA